MLSTFHILSIKLRYDISYISCPFPPILNSQSGLVNNKWCYTPKIDYWVPHKFCSQTLYQINRIWINECFQMFLVMLSVTGFNFKRTILQCSIYTSVFCITINLSIVSSFQLKYFVLASSNWKLLNQHQESSVTVLGQKHSMISPSMWSDIYIILRILLPSGHNSTSLFIGWYSLFLSLLHYDVILN